MIYLLTTFKLALTDTNHCISKVDFHHSWCVRYFSRLSLYSPRNNSKIYPNSTGRSVFLEKKIQLTFLETLNKIITHFIYHGKMYGRHQCGHCCKGISVGIAKAQSQLTLRQSNYTGWV